MHVKVCIRYLHCISWRLTHGPSVTCIFYNLCSRCHDHGAHTKGHQFLEIPTPEDADLLFNVSLKSRGRFQEAQSSLQPSEDLLPGNEVILGLRVYTDSTVEAKIEGQLRSVLFEFGSSLISKSL
jgi:hypothetical protein